MGTSFLNIGNNWLLYTGTHLFAKSVSCRSANFTTGDFECMVRLKKYTVQKSQLVPNTEPSRGMRCDEAPILKISE